MASRMTCALVVPFCAPPRLMKKLTVIGIIGQTQGVKIASSPPASPMMNTHQIDGVFGDVVLVRSLGDDVVMNSNVSGAVHILSSQALYRTRIVSALAMVSVKVPSYSSI